MTASPTSPVYDPDVHAYVVFATFGDCRPLEIVHTTGRPGVAPDRLWVHATYADELRDSAVQVGDGFSLGHDGDGNLIVSIPYAAAHCFLSGEEADRLMKLHAIDSQLLRHAIG